MIKTKQPSQTGADSESAPVCASDPSSLIAQHSAPTLLSVDCGLKTGLALYTLGGELLWYRSHNLGNLARLKRAAWQLLTGIAGLTHLVVEGGGPLAEVWVKTGERRGLAVTLLQAERWRNDLLLPRQQRSGKQAKQVADELAREIIARTGAAKPTSLRHDAAEAILVGWWAVQRLFV